MTRGIGAAKLSLQQELQGIRTTTLGSESFSADFQAAAAVVGVFALDRGHYPRVD